MGCLSEPVATSAATSIEAFSAAVVVDSTLILSCRFHFNCQNRIHRNISASAVTFTFTFTFVDRSEFDFASSFVSALVGVRSTSPKTFPLSLVLLTESHFLDFHGSDQVLHAFRASCFRLFLYNYFSFPPGFRSPLISLIFLKWYILTTISEVTISKSNYFETYGGHISKIEEEKFFLEALL